MKIILATAVIISQQVSPSAPATEGHSIIQRLSQYQAKTAKIQGGQFRQQLTKWRTLAESKKTAEAQALVGQLIADVDHIDWLSCAREFSTHLSFNEDEKLDDLHLNAEFLFHYIIINKSLIDPNNNIQVNRFLACLILAQGSSLLDAPSGDVSLPEKTALKSFVESDEYHKIKGVHQLIPGKTAKELVLCCTQIKQILSCYNKRIDDKDLNKISDALEMTKTSSHTTAMNIYRSIGMLRALIPQDSSDWKKVDNLLKSKITQDDYWFNGRLQALLKYKIDNTAGDQEASALSIIASCDEIIKNGGPKEDILKKLQTKP